MYLPGVQTLTVYVHTFMLQILLLRTFLSFSVTLFLDLTNGSMEIHPVLSFGPSKPLQPRHCFASVDLSGKLNTVSVWNPKVRISAFFKMVPFPNGSDFRQCLKPEPFCSDFRHSVWLFGLFCSFFFTRLDCFIYKKFLWPTLYIKRSSLLNRTNWTKQGQNRTHLCSVCQTERSVFGHLLYTVDVQKPYLSRFRTTQTIPVFRHSKSSKKLKRFCKKIL